LLWLFGDGGLENDLLRLALNWDSPNLSLPSSYESPVAGFLRHLNWYGNLPHVADPMLEQEDLEKKIHN
jgi:hypothetical protein